MSSDGVRQERLRASRREARTDALVVAVLFHTSMLALVFTAPLLPALILATLSLTAAVTLGGVTVLHHGAHNRLGRGTLSNAVWVHLASPVGFWVDFWSAKHRVHHMSPARYPDDLFTGASGLFRLHPRAPHHAIHRFQALYILPAYGGYWLVDQFSQWRYLVMARDPRYSHIVVPNRTLSFLREKSLSAVLIGPYVLMFEWRSGLAFLVAMVAGSFMAALLVSMNHVATGAVVGGSEELEWNDYVRYATINYSPTSRTATFLSGSLNLHSAHHLRPVQTRRQLLDTHQALQAEGTRGPVVTYSFLGAVRAHFAALRWLGSGGTADVIGDEEFVGRAVAKPVGTLVPIPASTVEGGTGARPI
jgi:linoleoyl-CoA desaturase